MTTSLQIPNMITINLRTLFSILKLNFYQPREHASTNIDISYLHGWLMEFYTPSNLKTNFIYIRKLQSRKRINKNRLHLISRVLIYRKKLIRHEKNDYYADQFNRNMSNIRHTLATVKEILDKYKEKSDFPFFTDGNKINDKLTTSNQFNNFLPRLALVCPIK